MSRPRKRNRTTALILAGLLLLALPALAGEKVLKGYIINNQGQKIRVEKFLDTLKEYPCVYQDSDLQVPLQDIKSLTLMDGGRVLVENRKGKKIVVFGEMGISFDDMMPFLAKNPVSGKLERREIDPLLLKKIVFD